MCLYNRFIAKFEASFNSILGLEDGSGHEHLGLPGNGNESHFVELKKANPKDHHISH